MPSYGIEQVLKYLPHRYPFLLIDKVEDYAEDGSHLVAIKNVTMNEPFFQGHFPENPIMPGVLHIEAIAQACALMGLSASSVSGLADKNTKYDTILMGIDNARFRRLIRPGDVLRIETKTLMRKGLMGKAQGTITVDGKVATECTLMFVLQPRKED